MKHQCFVICLEKNGANLYQLPSMHVDCIKDPLLHQTSILLRIGYCFFLSIFYLSLKGDTSGDWTDSIYNYSKTYCRAQYSQPIFPVTTLIHQKILRKQWKGSWSLQDAQMCLISS
jgi:hypothetical protein